MVRRTLSRITLACYLIWSLTLGLPGVDCDAEHAMCMEDLDWWKKVDHTLHTVQNVGFIGVVTGTLTSAFGTCSLGLCTFALTNPVGLLIFSASGLAALSQVWTEVNPEHMKYCGEARDRCSINISNLRAKAVVIILWVLLSYLYLHFRKFNDHRIRVAASAFTCFVLIIEAYSLQGQVFLVAALLFLQLSGEVSETFEEIDRSFRNIDTIAKQMHLSCWLQAQEDMLEWTFQLFIITRLSVIGASGLFLLGLSHLPLTYVARLLSACASMFIAAKFSMPIGGLLTSLIGNSQAASFISNSVGFWPVCVVFFASGLAATFSLQQASAGLANDIEVWLRFGLLAVSGLFCLPLVLVSVKHTFKMLHKYGARAHSLQFQVHDFLIGVQESLKDAPNDEEWQRRLRYARDHAADLKRELCFERISEQMDVEDIEWQEELERVTNRLRSNFLEFVNSRFASAPEVQEKKSEDLKANNNFKSTDHEATIKEEGAVELQSH